MIFLVCVSAVSFAQDASEDQSTRKSRIYQNGDATEQPDATQAELGGPETSEQLALPAERIIEILQQQPEALDALKQVAAQRLADQGRPVPESALTDDVLFSRIEQDEKLRITLTQELNARGYLSEADREYLGIATDTAQPQPRKRLVPKRPAREAEAGGSAKRPGREAEAAGDPNQPEATRRPTPYPNLPALDDLYRQLPSQKNNLQRFGMDIFLNGTGNAADLPTDLPAGPDYVLGSGDGLNINMWGSVSQRLMRTVDREGRIALPEAGTVLVAGYTLAEARNAIEKALRVQFRDVTADVSLTRLRTVRVYVVGDVVKPGAYDINSLSTPLNALYAAGGPTPRGSLRTVRHYRGDRLIREVDLYELLVHGVRSGSERLEPGDTILVPPVGPQVTVTGMIRRPAIYELRGEPQLSEVLDLAGGLLVSAALRQINVERIEAHQRRVMLSVNLPETNDKELIAKALGDFHVQDGDRVVISPILPYSDKTIYLQGHVFRPGKYPYHDGLQISDLIKSYQDLLPEPADRAEIVRLEPPDYRPTIIEFKLSEVISGDDPIELKAFDTIRILGRYEIDPPKVAIYGEVMRPGKYPLAHNMTVADLVRLAGGFKRSAYQARADVTSYVVQKGEKIRTEHRTVEIAKALAGDTAADFFLKPGDVVSIRQLTGWKEIGASATLNGQVMYPGTYGIEEGEKLSTLLRRAGGFRDDAYPEGAVLERVQVRQLAEKTRAELIQRIEVGGVTSLKGGGGANAGEQAAAMQAMMQQRQHILAVLRSQPASGRLVIKVSPDISQWRNTPVDITMQPGDVLTIPKQPDFILVSGQVYNATAITHIPGKNAEWYLKRAGGPTDLANKKDIYIIRANGSVFGQGSAGSGWWKGNVLSATMHPGDTLVVPEKILMPSSFWKNALTTAQLMSAMAITAGVVASF